MFNRWMSRAAIAVILMTVALLSAPDDGRAQILIRKDQPDLTITADTRTEVIEGVLKRLQDAYVFPDIAKKMDEALRERLKKKEYDNITSAKVLAKTLTDHLQEVSHDKHLRVNYSAEPLPKMKKSAPTPVERDKMRQNAASRNFGFQKVERLDGNIGYLALEGFMSPEQAGETAAAAMNFLANTDVLIIDLRRNGGGSPAMVALLCSYLFKAEPVVHLNDLYFRPDNSTHQWWTLPYLPGKRYVDKDVYVLTSKRTFSAAEEFTYNLKNLKRATIVGETTGGGAHPGGMQPINDHFFVFVPSGRAINPISKTNWEGTGVKPDVDVPAELALKTAHLAALKQVAEKKKDDPRATEELKKITETVQKELEELKTNNKKDVSAATR
jgi:C-terminal processing protease CtpA/Prc